MASVGVAPTSGLREPGANAGGIDKLPDEMNDMKIRDDKVNVSLLLHATLDCFGCLLGS